jgi:hypothetical protein
LWITSLIIKLIIWEVDMRDSEFQGDSRWQ